MDSAKAGMRGISALRFDFDLIDETPHPVLAWLNGLHNRMLRGMEMLGGVFIFG